MAYTVGGGPMTHTIHSAEAEPFANYELWRVSFGCVECRSTVSMTLAGEASASGQSMIAKVLAIHSGLREERAPSKKTLELAAVKGAPLHDRGAFPAGCDKCQEGAACS
jgi:hypothetical protein